jgi:hypothetical protein
MDGQPGQDDGEGAGQDRDPEPTPPASGSPVPNPAPSGPDPRLAAFAWDDSRHARESDFEHALPYDQGGWTCMCNVGARSRACHRVKQTRGWNLTQPRPGWHRWQTPAGRVYTQGPKRYPA